MYFFFFFFFQNVVLELFSWFPNVAAFINTNARSVIVETMASGDIMSTIQRRPEPPRVKLYRRYVEEHRGNGVVGLYKLNPVHP